MKQGRHLRIPERPDDVAELWASAGSIDPAQLPDWLSPEELPLYRYLGAGSYGGMQDVERAQCMAELAEAESAGLIVDHLPGQEIAHVYIGAPRRDAQWSIGIYSGSSPLLLRPDPAAQNPVLTYRDVTDVPAAFVADPFMVFHHGVWHMFFEVMNWRSGKGEIGLASSRNGLDWTYEQLVLVEPFHLSYPHVFKWNGDYYMVPECHQSFSVRLYKAAEFPFRWTFERELLQGDYLADATVFRYANQWWMLADASLDLEHDTLKLYRADELTGPWSEHSASPLVKGNPRVARPAGPVTLVEDRLVRFAQNCDPDYGTDVRAFEIEQLDERSYRERPLEPCPILGASGAGWNAHGMHHVDAHHLKDSRWLACVDGWRWTS